MNRKKTSMGRKVFLAVDVIVILLLCLICMVPLLNLLAYSFSASQPIIENKVFLWPKEFTLKAYQYVLESKEFWSSVSVSVKRVLLGVPLNTLLTILVAYPLSKDERQFKARKYYVAYKEEEKIHFVPYEDFYELLKPLIHMNEEKNEQAT